MTKQRTQMLSWDDSAPARRFGFVVLRLLLGLSFGFRALVYALGPTSLARSYDSLNIPFPLVAGGAVVLTFFLAGISLIGGRANLVSALFLVAALLASEIPNVIANQGQEAWCAMSFAQLLGLVAVVAMSGGLKVGRGFRVLGLKQA